MWWKFQSIDTMKYSRDYSRAGLPSSVIDTQVKNIAAAGATHVAIATPYDDEFLPFLTLWVDAARKYHLNVWFRGNWSGWEKWFGYPAIDRVSHQQKTISFIKSHSDLFMPGDVFTSCPECENGGAGDPRKTGDVDGYRKFIISEYQSCAAEFKKLNKNVACNFASMNGDVAYAVMNKDTTKAMGGLVVIDHYVDTPEHLAKDVQDIAQHSGGQVVLGEMGTPIPDINGKQTPAQQSAWLENAFDRLTWLPELVGINYWVNVGGSTEIWDASGKAYPAVSVVSKYFSPSVYRVHVSNVISQPLPFEVSYHGRTFASASDGTLSFPLLSDNGLYKVSSPSYKSRELPVVKGSLITQIVLDKNEENLWFKLAKLLFSLKSSIIL